MSRDRGNRAAVRIEVRGTPAPQGSKRAFTGRDGRAHVIESSHDRVKSWRQAVIDEVRSSLTLDGPLRGSLSVRIMFYLARPESHYGTGRNADRVKMSAPAFPAKTPDLSKLIRSTEDALTDAGLWADDAQVVEYAVAAKVYCIRGITLPGAVIEVNELEEI